MQSQRVVQFERSPLANGECRPGLQIRIIGVRHDGVQAVITAVHLDEHKFAFTLCRSRFRTERIRPQPRGGPCQRDHARGAEQLQKITTVG